MTVYLTGATNDRIEARLIALGCGLMVTPASGYRPERIARYPHVGVDSGCYAGGATFDRDRWLRYLERLAPHRAVIRFVAAPDVFADGPATLARALPELPRIRDLGLSAALVLQPGMTVPDVPWDAIDAVFTGGPDWWQRSTTVAEIVTEAGRRGLWRHRGRVNSRRRFVASAIAGYDSCDGTYIARNPEVLARRVATWMAAVHWQQRLALEAS